MSKGLSKDLIYSLKDNMVLNSPRLHMAPKWKKKKIKKTLHCLSSIKKKKKKNEGQEAHSKVLTNIGTVTSCSQYF